MKSFLAFLTPERSCGMATKAAKPSTDTKQDKPAEVAQTAEKEAKSFKDFFSKFSNDWVMNFSAGLAYNVLTAIFPIVIAIISIAGLFVGALDPAAKTNLIASLSKALPPPLNSGNVLGPALNQLSKNAGFLGIIAILLAIFGGSRLFVTMEGYFDVIYHTRPRDFIHQNIMAILMLLLFVILIPIMIVASSLPALFFSALQATPISQIPGIGFLFSLGGFFGTLLVSWILFLAIFIVVPNQHISFKNSWKGALVSGFLLALFLTLFPLYVTHFMNTYTGTTGFAVILLLFFYYFSVILLLGAEINAFYSENVKVTPADIPTMIHEYTSHLPTSEKAVQEQAAASHKGEEPKAIRPKKEVEHLQAQAQSKGATPATSTSTSAASDGHQTQAPDHHQKSQKQKVQGQSGVLTVAEAVAGTALAFGVELFRLRRRKKRAA
jgi:YihY family inner membrane protein